MWTLEVPLEPHGKVLHPQTRQRNSCLSPVQLQVSCVAGPFASELRHSSVGVRCALKSAPCIKRLSRAGRHEMFGIGVVAWLLQPMQGRSHRHFQTVAVWRCAWHLVSQICVFLKQGCVLPTGAYFWSAARAWVGCVALARAYSLPVYGKPFGGSGFDACVGAAACGAMWHTRRFHQKLAGQLPVATAAPNGRNAGFVHSICLRCVGVLASGRPSHIGGDRQAQSSCAFGCRPLAPGRPGG